MTAADFIRVLVEATLAGSAAVLVVLLVRRPLRAAFGAGVAYAAWGLVPVALTAVMLPAATAEPVLAPVAVEAVAVLAMPAVPGPVVRDAPEWWALAWLLGVLAMAARFWWQQRRFVRSLGRVLRRADGLHHAEAIAGLPAALGVLRPRIVVPADFATRYSNEQQRLMRVHEHAHIARGDPLANAFAAVLRCMFWFNPLLHAAARPFRHDQELACDQRVIARHPRARRAYGDAMFKTQLAAQPLPLGCHWGQTHPLKERIEMLRQPVPTMARWFGGALVVSALTVVGGMAAWAAQPRQALPAEAPPGTIAAKLALAIDGKAQGESDFVVQPGGRISLASSDGRYSVEGTVRRDTAREQGPLLMFAATISHDGKVVATPEIGMRSGQPGTIRIGEEKAAAGDTLEGIEVTVTLSDAGGTKAGGASAGITLRQAALDIAASHGLRIANPEVLSDTHRVSFNLDGVPAATALALMGEEAGQTARIEGGMVHFVAATNAAGQ